MSLLDTIKSALGLGTSRSRDPGTTVSVEHEQSATNERVVKETPPPETPAADDSADEDTDAIDEAEPDEAGEPVDSIKGIGPAYAERLSAAGIVTISDLAAADAADIAEQTEIAEGRLDEWIERAKGR